MVQLTHPAAAWLAARIRDSLVVGQVWIRRNGNVFELRHELDREAAEAALKNVDASGLRQVAQMTRGGRFRPLKAAPNLVSGWRHAAAGGDALFFAMNQLYPGAVTDWHAAETGRAGEMVTDYEPMTERQTGMYRITATLRGADAARMAEVCCDAEFCLKSRRWRAGGRAPSLEEGREPGKSVLPCLEPCPVLLEFARQVVRIEQGDTSELPRRPEELEAVRRMLDEARRGWAEGTSDLREADFAAENHPRRLRWLLARASGLAAACWMLAQSAGMAQLPGGDTSGLSWVLERVLAGAPSFEAVADLRITSVNRQDSMRMPVEFKYHATGRLRMEINMAQVQSPLLKQEMVMNLREIGMDRVVTIGGGTSRVTRILYPRVRACIEVPVTEPERPGWIPGKAVGPESKSRVSREPAGGRDCQKSLWRLDWPGAGSPREVWVWEAEGGNGVPVRVEIPDSNTLLAIEFGDVKVGRTGLEEFEMPSGYARYEGMEAVMQEAVGRLIDGEAGKGEVKD